VSEKRILNIMMMGVFIYDGFKQLSICIYKRLGLLITIIIWYFIKFITN